MSSSEIHLLLEKATSPRLLETDWDSTLQIVDLIRQGDTNPKATISSIMNKLKDPNPNIVLLALQVLECVVKNCGQVVHEQVAVYSITEQIYNVLRNSTNEDVRKKIVTMLATWAHAFRNESKYRAVQDIVNIIKAEGYQIPVVIESDAMFTADRAPEWIDGECCHRCRSQFTMIRRKHHCRACGQVFCSDCSGKYSCIPKFGFEREVRVCESCFDEINNGNSQAPPPASNAKRKPTEPEQTEAMQTTKSTGPPKKSEEELREEEELQLALALSKSEAENKEKEKLRATSTILGGGTWKQNSPITSPSPTNQPIVEKDEMDPELAKYLNRSYWEQQQNKSSNLKSNNDIGRVTSPTIPSAPYTKVASSPLKSPAKVNEWYQNGETDELDAFVATLSSQLEIFVNRMKSNQSRGRPISNDTAVQSLFTNIMAMHSQLLKYIQHQDERRLYCERLQDKISQIRDARAALEALREEHRERMRREKEEQERIRQLQMMQKLEIMRKKKQEYLEYQRQLALHRMAESEREIMKQVPAAPMVGYGMPYPPTYGAVPGAPMAYMYPPMQGDASGPGSFQPQIPGQPAPPGPHNYPPNAGPPGPQQQPAPPQPQTTNPPGFTPGQGEYTPYNMTAMANNLPSVPNFPPGAPGVPGVPHQHPGGMNPPQAVGQQPPVTMPNPQNPGMAPPPTTDPMAQPPPPQESAPQQQAELISFD